MKSHERPGFIPPYQDLATLAEHVCMGERTIEEHIGQGIFPKHTKMQGGKRLWSWKVVTMHLDGKGQDAPLSPGPKQGEIADAVRKEVESAHAKA